MEFNFLRVKLASFPKSVYALIQRVDLRGVCYEWLWYIFCIGFIPSSFRVEDSPGFWNRCVSKSVIICHFVAVLEETL